MLPSPRRPAPGRGRRLAPSLVAAALCAATTAAQAPEPTAADRQRAETSAPYRVALEKLGELEAREGTRRARSEILMRNLSRYFTTYVVPPEADELRRVLGTAQRMTQQAARLFYRASQAAASGSGATRVTPAHVEAVARSLLPTGASREADRLVFFPEAEPVVLETWDLEALLDTGLAWEALGNLAEAEILRNPGALPLRDDAATALAEQVNRYGLLVFRLAGRHAKAQLAPHVRTSHLRDAGKTIAARAKGEPSPIGRPPTPAEAGLLFRDATDALGIDFEHTSSSWISRFRRFGPIAPTFSGGGVAAGDLDLDGWDDLVVCGGRGCQAWRNEGGERFATEAAWSAISVAGEARAPVLADFDNDGDLDLFVTYARDTNRIFENLGPGKGFRDVTEASGLAREGDISGPACAVDVDGDGRLDLYVGNFGNYLAGESAWVAQDAKNGMANRLYVNQGGLRFAETKAGVEDTGWAQALSHLDYDGDGDQDLYVANDFGRNQLLENDGTGTFTPAGERTGSDDRHHGMNVAFADLNRDLLPDIFVTNIWFWASARREVTETNTLLLSQREADGVTYRESDAAALLDHDSSWAWAGLFFDVENDGDDDLFVSNGFTDYMTFVQYREHPEIPNQLYATSNARTPNLFFRGSGEGMPSELVEGSGVELDGINSRSAALLDYDRDGDLDLAVTTFHDRLRLFENIAPAGGGALTVALVGDPGRGTPRDAIGATVVARASEGAGPPDLQVWRAVQGGEGYLGMNSLPLEFGVGSATAVDLEITWPGGEVQRVRGLEPGRAVRIEQGREDATVLWTFP